MDQRTITDRSAWVGTDLDSDPSWTQDLDDADRAAIDRALRHVNEQGLTLDSIGRRHFPLGPLEAKLALIKAEIETGRGVSLLRGLDVDRYDLDDLEKIYWGICAHLGTGMTQNSDASLIHYVTDGVLRPNQGSRGVGSPLRSSLHVDLTDCVSLLCVRQAPDDPASWVASSTTVHNELLAHHPEALPPLYEGFEWDRLGEHGSNEESTTGYRVPVFSEAEGLVSCRYNRYWMAKAMQRTQERLPEEIWSLFNLFDETAHRVRYEIDFAPGDIQFVNNYVALHGREAHAVVEAEERKRLLMRIWVDFDQPRPVVDEATVRYGIVRHGALGWTADQYRAGLHRQAHARDDDGRPLVGAGVA